MLKLFVLPSARMDRFSTEERVSPARPDANVFLKDVLVRVSVIALLFLSTISFADDRVLTEGDGWKWYRGNMHTHSLWSDGDDYPEMIGHWYRDHRYDFLVYTDHNILHQSDKWVDIEKNKGGLKAFEKLKEKFPGDWIQTREKDGRQEVRLKKFDEVFDRLAIPQKFLLIQGEEITDRFQNRPVHLCATNTLDLLPPLHGESVAEVIQNNINAAVSHRERTGQKTLVHLNHPNFGYGVTAEDLMKVVGENFFEIYNGHPSVNNSGDETHASTERMWDIINTWRLAKLDLPLMYGLATDDGHSYFEKTPGKASQPGRGWVMVLAETLTPDAIVTSLEAGRFYSSSGVHLQHVSSTEKTLSVQVAGNAEATYTIEFIGTLRDFSDQTSPAVDDPEKAAAITRRYSEDVGKLLQSSQGTEATYTFRGDELYVRAVITSSVKHPNPSEAGDFQQAWTQPVIPPSR
ncbi:MAG: hypothetical protein KDA81_09565 [Planctomycetaceae bacterium]|nr:hypothetical protein [Planctomycetaceae bacterium]